MTERRAEGVEPAAGRPPALEAITENLVENVQFPKWCLLALC